VQYETNRMWTKKSKEILSTSNVIRCPLAKYSTVIVKNVNVLENSIDKR
jgi:hypothetical protein